MKKFAILLCILFALLILSLGVSAQLKVWGSNDRGKLGIGNVVTPLANPFTITGLPDATAASGNSQYSIFLKANGRIFSSGDNQLGQLGNGNVTSQGLGKKPGRYDRKWNGVEFRLPMPAFTCPNIRWDGKRFHRLRRVFGYAAIPSFSTSTSVNSVWQFGNNVTFFFPAVTTAGTTGYTSLDPATTGLNIPPGYTVQNRAPAYNITSTVVSPTNYVCLSVPSEYDPSEFALLKILHEENGDLVDRTVSSVFIKRQVCAETPSFGRLVVAKGTTPTPAAVTVWGRILNTAGQGVGNATVNMTDEHGILRQAITGTLGYYSFDSVKPLGSYTIEPTAKRYRFPQRTVTVVGNLADLNFTSQ